MAKEKTILEVRRHSRLSSILAAISLSVLGAVYLFVPQSEGWEAIVAPSALGMRMVEWQTQHPVWSAIFWVIGWSYMAVKLGQTASRLDLYGTRTNLPVEFAPWLCVAIVTNGASLRVGALAFFIVWSLSSTLSAYRSTNSVGLLLSSSLALGAAATIYPAAITLWGVVPIMLIIFERTLREVIVATMSLIIVPFGYIYISWLRGADFSAKLSEFGALITRQSGYEMWSSMSVGQMVGVGFVVVVTLHALLSMAKLENSVKARRRLSVVSVYLAAIVAMLLLPSADSSPFMLCAIPLSILIPISLLGLGRVGSFIIYVLLFVGLGLLNLF